LPLIEADSESEGLGGQTAQVYPEGDGPRVTQESPPQRKLQSVAAKLRGMQLLEIEKLSGAQQAREEPLG